MKPLWTTAFLLLTGCATQDGDGRDDSFTSSGKADTGGVEEGSKEARGVLRVANESSLDALRGEVDLADTAAEAIAAYRVGDDERTGTEDDQRFDTLAELDAVPFVGPVAFSKLLAYAKAQGYLDPACGDGILERGELCYQRSQLELGIQKVVHGAIADMNADGNQDIVLTTSDGGLYVYTGDGRGSFLAQLRSAASSWFGAFTVGDIYFGNGPDVVASLDTRTRAFRNDGGAMFQERDGYLSTGEPALGSFDGDGSLDLAVVGHPQQGPLVQVRLNDGGGIFGPQATYAAGCSTPRRPQVLDVDRDGFVDVAYTCAGTSFGVLRGRGDGTFHAAVVHPLPDVPSEVTLADFNGDGRPDVAASAAGEPTVVVQHANGDGSFGPMTYFFPTSTQSDNLTAIVARDLDGDQVLDLAVVSGSQKLYLLRGDGHGLFFDPVSVSVAAGEQRPESLHAGDLNGDGRPDFLVIHPVAFGRPGRVTLVLSNP